MLNKEHHNRSTPFPSDPIDNDIVSDIILIVLLCLKCFCFSVFVKIYHFHLCNSNYRKKCSSYQRACLNSVTTTIFTQTNLGLRYLPGILFHILTCTFTHSIEFHQGQVQTHEEIERLAHDWCCPCQAKLATLQTKSETCLPEHKSVGNCPTKWCGPTAQEMIQKVYKIYIQKVKSNA